MRNDPYGLDYLKIINGLFILFWVIYFLDPFLPETTSVETVRDFETFSLKGRGGRSGSVQYKKLITDQRHFTVYAEENDFFITDTVEIKSTQIFGLVDKYRRYSPGEADNWTVSEYAPYRRWPALFISIGLLILSCYGAFFTKKKGTLKIVSLLTISGGVIFCMSTLL